MYVCIYVCMYVRMYVCLFTCMYLSSWSLDQCVLIERCVPCSSVPLPNFKFTPWCTQLDITSSQLATLLCNASGTLLAHWQTLLGGRADQIILRRVQVRSTVYVCVCEGVGGVEMKRVQSRAVSRIAGVYASLFRVFHVMHVCICVCVYVCVCVCVYVRLDTYTQLSIVRYAQAANQCVRFHFDRWPRTMHIALNDETAYAGARSVHVCPTRGLTMQPRPVGSATVHTDQCVHGVTVMGHGVRYSLFVLQLHDQ
jgi:hypothetical protein